MVAVFVAINDSVILSKTFLKALAFFISLLIMVLNFLNLRLFGNSFCCLLFSTIDIDYVIFRGSSILHLSITSSCNRGF